MKLSNKELADRLQNEHINKRELETGLVCEHNETKSEGRTRFFFLWSLCDDSNNVMWFESDVDIKRMTVKEIKKRKNVL